MEAAQQPHAYPQQYGYYDYYQTQYFHQPPIDPKWSCPMMNQEYSMPNSQFYNHNGNYSFPVQYANQNQ
jgi:hypothetical protein